MDEGIGDAYWWDGGYYEQHTNIVHNVGDVLKFGDEFYIVVLRLDKGKFCNILKKIDFLEDRHEFYIKINSSIISYNYIIGYGV